MTRPAATSRLRTPAILRRSLRARLVAYFVLLAVVTVALLSLLVNARATEYLGGVRCRTARRGGGSEGRRRRGVARGAATQRDLHCRTTGRGDERQRRHPNAAARRGQRGGNRGGHRLGPRHARLCRRPELRLGGARRARRIGDHPRLDGPRARGHQPCRRDVLRPRTHEHDGGGRRRVVAHRRADDRGRHADLRLQRRARGRAGRVPRPGAPRPDCPRTHRPRRHRGGLPGRWRRPPHLECHRRRGRRGDRHRGSERRAGAGRTGRRATTPCPARR